MGSVYGVKPYPSAPAPRRASQAWPVSCRREKSLLSGFRTTPRGRARLSPARRLVNLPTTAPQPGLSPGVRPARRGPGKAHAAGQFRDDPLDAPRHVRRRGQAGKVGTKEFRRKLRALRGLCQHIVELRRGDHSGVRLQLERERREREREKNEEEAGAHFERGAKISLAGE